MNYLIKTAGRTGSHKVMYYISHNTNSKIIDVDNPTINFDKDITYIAHCHHQYTNGEHNVFMPSDPKNWILIKTYRNNIFDQTLSDYIHLITREQLSRPYLYQSDLKNIEIKPFLIDYELFKRNLEYFYNQEQIIKDIDATKFHSCIELNYNEIVNNSFVEKLPFKGDINKIPTIKNPWDKKSIIKNYKKLKRLYENLY